MLVIDDHLLRDLVADEFPAALADFGEDMATTNLWVFRLLSALVRHRPGDLTDEERARLAQDVAERLDGVTIVPMRTVVWAMAELQERHRAAGRGLSAAMAETLAAAQFLGAGIAVAADDVGPALQAASAADDVPFYVVER